MAAEERPCENSCQVSMKENSNSDKDSSNESVEDIYEVEKIVGISKVKGQQLYKVRWSGYGPEHDTWEPRANLSSCLDLIEAYEKEHPSKKSERESKSSKSGSSKSSSTDTTKQQGARKKRPSYYKYVGSSDEEADTLKDKFWRDLEEGKIDVFSRGDLYSKVKGSNRSSRPQSFKEGTETSEADPDSSKESRKKSSDVPVTKVEPTTSSSTKSNRTVKQSSKRSRKRSTEKSGKKPRVKTEVVEDSSAIKKDASEPSVSHSPVYPSPISYSPVYTSSVSQSPVYTSEATPSPSSVSTSPVSSSSISTSPASRSPVYVASPRVSPTPSSVEQTAYIDISPVQSSPVCTPSYQTVTPVDSPLSGGGQLTIDLPSMKEEQPQSYDNDPISQDTSQQLNTTVVACESLAPSDTHTPSLPLLHTASPPLIPTPAMKKGGPQVSQSLTEHAPDPYSQDLPLQTPPSICSSAPSPGETSSLQLHDLLLHSSHPSSFLTNTPTTSGGSLTPCSAISGQDFSPQESSDSLSLIPAPLPLSPNLQGDKLQPPSCNDLEEMEFDLMDVDPTFWQEKICERKLMPEYLELSNMEFREVVCTNDYLRLTLALKAPTTYDLEQPDANGTTLLMIAASRGYNDVLELLAVNGAAVNATQKNGTSALMMAAELGLEVTVSLLLQLGAHLSLHTYTGDTVLTKGIRRGHSGIVQQLLEHGANFSCPHTHPELSPLAVAKSMNQMDIVSALCSHIDRVQREFERQVQITLNNCAVLQGELFPLQCFCLRETERFKVTFRHELQPTQTGMGMLLFIAHARLSEKEVRCRFYGPCAIKSAMLNGVKLKPLTEEANFVLSFSPLHNGRNELDVYTAAAPYSKAKLLVCAYRAAVI